MRWGPDILFLSVSVSVSISVCVCLCLSLSLSLHYMYTSICCRTVIFISNRTPLIIRISASMGNFCLHASTPEINIHILFGSVPVS